MTAENVDPNKIVSEIVTTLTKDVFKKVAEGSSSVMKKSWQKISENFLPYIDKIYGKCSKVRVLCVKEYDLPLYDIYVSSYFKSKDYILGDNELIKFISDGNNVIIYGNGGAGKTFFMRHLWLSLLAPAYTVLPIFIELRVLNDLSKCDLKALIRHSLSDGSLDEDVFDYFASRGRFCFVLDGFDEVSEGVRDELQGQIFTLSTKFTNCQFVISSRPDSRFSGWQNFRIFESEPFKLEQTKELIGKIPFDQDSKNVFLRKLDTEFFEANKSFLSSPLLSIMMLMTFKESMETPDNMNIFYDQAFNTLFHWHDATKTYSRDKTMNIEEFKKSFSVFCFISYCNESYEFTLSEMFDYIEKSNEINNFDFDKNKIVKEYVESINLMQQEGLKFIFIHRSFQEYFAAYCLMNIFSDRVGELIDHLGSRRFDNFFSMAYDMDQELFSRHYIVPNKEKIIDQLPKRFLTKNPFRVLSKIGFSFSIWCADEESTGPSLGYDFHEDFRVFKSIVEMLIGGKTANWDAGLTNDFIQTCFDKGRYLNEKFPRDTAGMEVKFEFREDHCFPRIVVYKGAKSRRKSLDRLLTELVEQMTPTLIELARTQQHQINTIRKWCEERSNESVRRGKSIDEILAF